MTFDHYRLLVAVCLVFLGFVAPAHSQVPQPEPNTSDFFGAVQESVYSNKYFGFSISVPTGWTVVDEADKAFAEKTVREHLERRNKADYIPPKFTTVTLLYLKKKGLGVASGNALFRIAATYQPHAKTITAVSVAKASREKVVGNPFLAEISEVTSLQIANKCFAALEYSLNSNPKKPLRSRHFVTLLNGYSVGFTVSFFDEADKKQLMGLINSLSIR